MCLFVWVWWWFGLRGRRFFSSSTLAGEKFGGAKGSEQPLQICDKRGGVGSGLCGRLQVVFTPPRALSGKWAESSCKYLQGTYLGKQGGKVSSYLGSSIRDEMLALISQ